MKRCNYRGITVEKQRYAIPTLQKKFKGGKKPAWPAIVTWAFYIIIKTGNTNNALRSSDLFKYFASEINMPFLLLFIRRKLKRRMLELRPCCENCGKDLPNDSAEAMICTYECTYCTECVENILENVCPNCGGGFEKRPTRPKNGLAKYPMKNEKLIHPVSDNKFLEKNRNIDPRKR